MEVKIICAIDKNGVLGKDGDLVLTHKEDFKRFKYLTKDHVVVMGRKTWESLPSKPLPNRVNVVLSRDENLHLIDEGALVTSNFQSILEHYKDTDKIIWIIGGGEIYKNYINSANELHITRWDQEVEGDTYFPNIDPEVWSRKYIQYPDNNVNGFVYETWIKKDKI